MKMNKNSHDCEQFDLHELKSSKVVKKLLLVFVFVLGLICSVGNISASADTVNKGSEPEWNQEVFYQIKSEKENYPFYKLRYKSEVESQKENLQVNGYDYKYTYTTYSSITGAYRDIYCLVSAKEVQDSPKTIEVFVNSRGEELEVQPTHTLPTKPEDAIASQA
jgi:hypothetical protein